MHRSALRAAGPRCLARLHRPRRKPSPRPYSDSPAAPDRRSRTRSRRPARSRPARRYTDSPMRSGSNSGAPSRRASAARARTTRCRWRRDARRSRRRPQCPPAAPDAARTAASASRRARRAGRPGPVAQQPLPVSVPVALLHRLALVVLLLAFRETDVELDAAAAVVEIERHERVAGTLDLADEAADLVAMEQQLARARRIGANMCRRRRKRCHMRAEEHDLAALDDHVGFLELRPSRPDRLHLPAFERDPRLELLLDELVVLGFFVVDDAHGGDPDASRRPARGRRLILM